jgi:hypothetical protein
VFAIWKIALLLNPTRQKGEWVRTTRPDDR